jgi:hypothetical protein
VFPFWRKNIHLAGDEKGGAKPRGPLHVALVDLNVPFAVDGAIQERVFLLAVHGIDRVLFVGLKRVREGGGGIETGGVNSRPIPTTNNKLAPMADGMAHGGKAKMVPVYQNE